jgi:hypothetical protein
MDKIQKITIGILVVVAGTFAIIMTVNYINEQVNQQYTFLPNMVYGQTGIETFEGDNFKYQYNLSRWDFEGEPNRFNGDLTKLSKSDNTLVMMREVTDDGVTDEEIIQRLKDIMDSPANAKLNPILFESSTTKYIINNQTAPYVIYTEDICTYQYIKQDCKDMVHLLMIVKLPNRFVMVQYLSPEATFDRVLPEVETILHTIKPTLNK